MATELTAPTGLNVAPEFLEIANCYLTHGAMSNEETAKYLGVSTDIVVNALKNKHVDKYINAVLLDRGYSNRGKLQAALDKLIEKKLEELEELELTSSKDIAELLMMQHKIRMDYEKMDTEKSKTTLGTQVNIQNNSYGENYNDLLSKIFEH